MIERCPYCGNKVDKYDYFCNNCNKYFISEMIKKKKSEKELDYINYARLGANNYILARLSLYNNGLERSAAYLIQQTIELYLKAFILKHYVVYRKRNKREKLFSWDDVPGNNNGKFIDFLKQDYSIDWVNGNNIQKSVDRNTIIASTRNNSLSLSFNNDKTKVNLKIDNDRTDEFMAEMENGKLNIYRGEYYDLFINRYLEYEYREKKNILKKGQKVNTHNIRKLLKYCKGKKGIFRNGFFEALVKAFDDFNEIRYPSRLCIDKQIIHPIDYFVKTVRNLIDPNIIDTISYLLSGGIADDEMRLDNDLIRSFFHENNQFLDPRKRSRAI